MLPTLLFIETNFATFNRKYFRGMLPQPLFEVSHTSHALGDCRVPSSVNGRYRIRISDFYDRTERDIQQTILHEMVHMYVHLVYGELGHGSNFKSIARQLNILGGWDIKRTTPVGEESKASAPARAPRRRNYHVVVFRDSSNLERPFQIALLTASRYGALLKIIEQEPKFTVVAKIVTTDPAFDRYVTSRDRISYYPFSAEELRSRHPRLNEFLGAK